MWVKKQQLEPCMEKLIDSRLRKEYVYCQVWEKGCLLSPCFFNLYAEHIMRNASLDELQAGINIGGRNTKNFRYADDTILMTESKEELKETLKKSERGEWKTWLKTQYSKNYDHGIWSHHFMANTRGKSWKQWQILLSWAPNSLQKVTAVMKIKDTCSLEEKLCQF